MGRLRSARGQQGQTSAEYVGILAFVAAVVALVVMSAADIGATVVDEVQEAICTVTGGDCGDGVTEARAAAAETRSGQPTPALAKAAATMKVAKGRARRIRTRVRTLMTTRPIRR